MYWPRHFQRRGLSRVDVVLLIVLSGLVLSFVVIALQPRQYDEAKTSRFNQLKQVAFACHAFQDSFKTLPPAFDKHDLNFAASVHVHLLPFVEQYNLFKMMLVAGNADVADNHHVLSFVSWTDPSQGDWNGAQNQAANLRVFSDKGLKTPWNWDLPALAAIEPGSAAIPETFTDGTQNTILFATKYGACGAGGSRIKAPPNSPFAAFFGQNAATTLADNQDPGATFQVLPGQNDCRINPLLPQGFSSAGLDVALADASARTLSPTIRARIWNLLLQPNDGQTQREEWE